MSFVDDIAYYRRRESQERMASEDAVGDAARKAHKTLATYYAECAENAENALLVTERTGRPLKSEPSPREIGRISRSAV